MFAASKTAAVSGAAPDDKFNYVTMLLHGDGTNGAQNNTFVDSSSNAFSITRNGNTTQGSFSPYGSNWSNYFDGSSYLTIPDNAAWNMGSGDFTAEAWIYPTSYSNESMIMGQWSGDLGGTGLNWALMFSSGGTGYLRLITSSNGSGVLFDLSTSSTSFALPLNTWQHVAAVRNGSTFTLYVNGVSRATTTNASALYDATNVFTIGAESNSVTQYFNGYISNTRVVKGTAVYTSAFTPSTTPLTAISGTVLLTCQSNRFIDNSSNAFTLTVVSAPSVQRFNPFGASTAYSTSVIGGSGYFDGTSDWLSIPTNNAPTGGSAYTIEAWIYVTDFTNSRQAICGWGELSSNSCNVFRTDGSGALKNYYYANDFTVATPTTLLNCWNHVVAQNDGTTQSIYMNGVRLGTKTTTPSVTTNTTLRIGNQPVNANSEQFNGYMCDLRVSNVARYSGATYTVPTAPVASSANTSFLLNYINGAIYDNAMMNDLETVGNAQISTSVVKYGTGSLAFDGTGDWLITPATPSNRINTKGNFTIEFWVYFNSVASDQRLIAWDNNSSNFVIAMYTSSSGVLAYYLSSNGTSWDIAQNAPMGNISTNTWYHIALVRDGNVFTPYVNGVGGTTTTSSATLYSSTLPFVIGATGNGASNFNGYMDEFRITKGYARYTANFTPPTAAFSDKGPN